VTSNVTSEPAVDVAEPHILVVTGDNYDGVDERSFTIEHVGPVVDCAMWVPCLPENPCHRQEYDLEETATGNPTFHGIEHSWIFDAGWSVRADPVECFYASGFAADRLPDLVVDRAFAHQPGEMPAPLYAGRYAITPEYEGDGEFDVTVDRRIPTRMRVTGGLFNARVPDGAVYVGRPAPYLPRSAWANPFKMGRTTPAMVNVGGRTRQMVTALGGAAPATHAATVAWYELMIEVFGLRDQVRAELAGRDLACWCPPEWACHADVLLRIANGTP
jgi:hypothetical protein